MKGHFVAVSRRRPMPEEGLGQNKQDAKTKALSDYVQILQPLVSQSCIAD